MMSRGRMLRSAGIGAAATPVAIALIVRWSVGGVPPAAHATSEEFDRGPAAAPLPRLTEPQRNLVVYAQAALAQPLGTSPLHNAAAAQPESPRDEPRASPSAPAAIIPTAPDFHVKSVLVSSKGALATINGRLRRIGDEIEPQWRLRAIDVDQGVVRIEGPSERIVEIPIGHLIK